MALFDDSYLPPGVYTQEEFNPAPASLSNTVRIPCLIGEGTSTFTKTVEMHRGSSATSDDQVVNQDLTAQVTGSTSTFQLSFYPVVTGDGTGTITNDPSKIQVTANGISVTVVSLNGTTGVFQTSVIIPVGQVLTATYFFKRKDTLITNESWNSQIPAFASLTLGSSPNNIVFTPQIVGALANNTTVALTLTPSNGKPDSSAISGIGTDTISIEIYNSTTSAARTWAQLATLVNTGTPTLSAGYIIAAASSVVAATAQSATHFSGGVGPNTNTSFFTVNAPIVDGTNGGVVTNNPTAVTVTVNGSPVTVSAVNGLTGQVTLANPIGYGANLRATYYTNTWQFTADALPDQGVTSIVTVGYSPNSNNFVQNTDYTLSGNQIIWGAAVNVTAGQVTSGFASLAAAVTPTLIDEKVWFQLASGTSNSKNFNFTLIDSPVDGSGLGRATNNPIFLNAWIGTTPYTAFQAGSVAIANVDGDAGTIELYNPPPAGSNVYVSYYRTILNDHTFTLTVQTPGLSGTGKYIITDEANLVCPSTVVGATSVANANFTTTGIVWPNNQSDLQAAIGGADETVTITFQNDSLTYISTPAVQASLTVADSSSHNKLVFRNTTPGTAGNSVTITFVNGPSTADSAALDVSGDALTVELLKSDGVTIRTWQDVLNLTTTYPVSTTDGGLLICTQYPSADLTSQAIPLVATNFAGGANAITSPYAIRYLVTTSRTAAQASVDGLGLTGGATTPGGTNTTLGAVGYCGQTYIDPVTAVTFTIVDPPSALSFGYTQLPSPQYRFAPNDTLTFVISRENGQVVGVKPVNAIPGIQLEVTTTFGMNVGDTAIVQTFHNDANEPAVGDYYWVTYTVTKPAAAYGVQLFNTAADAYTVYGQPSPSNRLATAIQLMTENGATQFAAIQVPTTGLASIASDQNYINAINLLANPLPGGVGRKINLIVPLSTSPNVHQYLSQFLNRQATPRNKGEAVGWVGYDQFQSPQTISTNAAAIGNSRVRAVYPNVLGWNYQASNSVGAVEVALDGTFLAAAAAGLEVSGTNDVATTLTNQNIVGFTRGLVNADSPTMNLMAVNGVTVFTDNNGALNCRHYKTTDPTNILTSEPYVQTTADFIVQAVRSLLKQFIGRKETGNLTGTIASVINSQLFAWNNDIISAYGQVEVAQSPTDPTTYNIKIPVAPMFSDLYMNVTLNVSVSA